MENNKLIAIFLVFLAVILFLLFDVSNQKNTNKESEIEPTAAAEEVVLPKPNMQIDQTKKYSAVISTSAGRIVISLNAKETPITVNNFVYLANKNFYENTVFHRVIEGFMIQGGAANSDGSGGPGYMFDDEPFEGEYIRGTVAMANAGPNTNGSQFFIMHQDYQLSPDYVIFGKVSEGMDTVDKIASAEVKENPASGEKSVPADPVVVQKIEIKEE